MQLADFLEQELIVDALQAEEKPAVLQELLVPLVKRFPEIDQTKAYEVLMEREKLGSTGIGEGIAIPHGKLDSLEKIVLVVGRSQQGVDFDALDHQPCHIFFLVLAPEAVAGLHLRILAHISRILKDPAFRRAFMEAEGRDGLWSLLSSV